MKPTQKSDEIWAREIATMTKDHEVHVPAKGEPQFIPKRAYICAVDGVPEHYVYHAINLPKARWMAFKAYREATGYKDFQKFLTFAKIWRRPE